MLTDIERAAVQVEYERILATCAPHGLESTITQQFRESFAAGYFEDRIPLVAADTIVYEMAFKYGRADIVVFHVDGTASVIEVKDGTRGYNHVVSGLGQAGLYASQLAMNRGSLRRVRKCLLWTSTGNVELDGVIEAMCEQAGAIALPWGLMASLTSVRAAAEAVLGSKAKKHG